MSLNTVQFAVEAGGASNVADMAVMRQQLLAAVEVAKSGRNALFVVSSVTAAVVVNAVNAAAEMTASLEGTEAGAVVFAHFVLAIATDQNNLNTAKFQMANRTALPYFPIFFGSFLYPYWEPGNANMFLRAFPDAIHVLLETIHSPGAEEGSEHLLRTPDFVLE